MVSGSSHTKLSRGTTKPPEAAWAGGCQRASSSLPSKDGHAHVGGATLRKGLVLLPLPIKQAHGMAVQFPPRLPFCIRGTLKYLPFQLTRTTVSENRKHKSQFHRAGLLRTVKGKNHAAAKKRKHSSLLSLVFVVLPGPSSLNPVEMC